MSDRRRSALRRGAAGDRVDEGADDVERRLERAMGRYDDALAAGDEERVAKARLALCQELRQAGWEAPEVVVGQMLRDAALIEQASKVHHELPVIPQQTRRAVSPVEVLQEH